MTATSGQEPSGAVGATGFAAGAARALVDARRNEILELAARRAASNVRLFGSVARGDDGPDSDFDFMVALAPGTGFVQLAGLKLDLEALLSRPVDVAPADVLKARVRRSALEEVVTL
jgi:predicted nucleotidyltransferase